VDLILYDDAFAGVWQPLTLTRPAGELLFGAYTFRERAETILGVRCRGHMVPPRLAGFDEFGCAPELRPESVPSDTPRLFLNSRFVPDWDARFVEPKTSGPVTCGDAIAGWFAAAGTAAPTVEEIEAASGPAGLELPGTFVEYIWDLVDQNAAQLATDLVRGPAPPSAVLPGHVHVLGPASDLRVARDVFFEPGVVIDATDGPVRLDQGVRIRSFTRLEGPIHVGRDTTILGGAISSASIGPHCKVRGEVEASILLGYSNKAHDGFLGHAYVGRWVNLGALTTNSDLKNNYRPVRVWTPEGERDTGTLKVGCFLGDHVKTAIGTLLNTGTVVGAGANLFGAGMPPKYVPPFAWGGASDARYELDRFLDTASVATARRGVVFSEGMRRVFETAWRESQP